jgi:hypothetical protein
MPDLKSTPEELKQMFPGSVRGLEAITTENRIDHLRALFLQRGTRDKNRNWAAWKRWRERVMHQDSVEIPEGMMAEIYWDNDDYFRAGYFAAGDKLLMGVSLWRDDYKTARLSKIVMNPCPSVQGAGAGFYKRLIPWLDAKGFRFLVGFPRDDRLARYWRRLGMHSLDDVNMNLRPMVNPTMDYGSVGCYCHFLDPKDPAIFLKPEALRKNGTGR